METNGRENAEDVEAESGRAMSRARPGTGGASLRFAGIGLAVVVAGTAALWAQQPGPGDMPQEMIWVDRTGKVLGRVGSVQNSMFFPEISPDGSLIAVSARDGEVNDRDVWLHDIKTGK